MAEKEMWRVQKYRRSDMDSEIAKPRRQDLGPGFREVALGKQGHDRIFLMNFPGVLLRT